MVGLVACGLYIFDGPSGRAKVMKRSIFYLDDEDACLGNFFFFFSQEL